MAQDSQLTKMKITRAALMLFVARGIAATTTKEIAKAAGVSEGAIYRHYPSKDDLAFRLFEDVHLRLTDLVLDAADGPAPLPEKVERVVAAYCETADRDWLLFTYHLLNQHHLLPRFDNAKLNPVEAVKIIIERAMSEGTIPKGDAEVLTNAVLGVVIQPAISKAYGRWDGDLRDHHPLFVRSICGILNIDPNLKAVGREASL